jgi:predicted amidohydrolase YtcJ
MSTPARRAAGLLVLLVLVVIVVPAARAQAPAPRPGTPATLVLQGGRIVTLDEGTPEATAMAVINDTVVALGTPDSIRRYIAPTTTVIDLRGALAVPGFIDSHAHFSGIGEAKRELGLASTTSWDEIVGKVADAVKKAKPGAWILGRGWHQEKWTKRPEPNVEGFPTHASLDRVSPDNPVILTHASGHAAIANAKAMALAGVTRNTPNPAGGEILHDPAGDPTGVFRETASGLIGRAHAVARARMTPAELEAEALEIIRLADQECLSKGITTLHTAGESFSGIDRLKRVTQDGRLGIRLYVMVGESNARMKDGLAKYRTIGFGDKHLTVRAIKAYMDGALGSRGAWLLEPYADLPASTGLNTTPLAELRETAELAIANDYQLCIHAIGDRANRELLNLYEETFKAHAGRKDLRWRDEHTQHLSAADIPRYGRLGVIAAMQGIHCTSDAPFVLARLGPRRAEEGAYVWQKLMKTGAVIANGTDSPVEDVDPIPNFFATTTRRLKDGSVFFGDQRMTRMEALKSYTINGAFAAFEERIKGSLSPGKLADITVLSRDILSVPENEIPAAKVLYTIVGGKVLYAAK